MNDPHLKSEIVNTVWCVKEIKKGTQECYPKIEELKYQDLQNNREKMLNLISVYDFLRNF